MNRKLRVPLLAVVILAIALPTGFALAQVVDGEAESERPPITHTDPDQSTDAVEIGNEYEAAQESGDPRALQQAAAAVRDEWLSRLGPEEKAALSGATPEASVPAGTYAYLNPAINQGQINQCRGWLAEGRDDQLCELIVLYGEGKIEAGPYTRADVAVALGQKDESR